MTAPRNCRQCGTALPPSVRRCLRCLEPVREMSPRPSAEGSYVGPMQQEVRYSRWRAGPLTFGPLGRVAITVVVVLVGLSTMVGGFNPAWLWFLGGYMVAATLILKQTWKKVRIPDSEARRLPAEPHPRHPVLSRQVEPKILWGALSLVAVAAVVAVVRSMGVDDLFLPIAALVMLGVALFLAWLSGV
jgi:hypothetical protein